MQVGDDMDANGWSVSIGEGNEKEELLWLYGENPTFGPFGLSSIENRSHERLLILRERLVKALKQIDLELRSQPQRRSLQ
jgi:hypothetical protein